MTPTRTTDESRDSFREALLAHRDRVVRDHASVSAELTELMQKRSRLDDELGHIDALLGENGDDACTDERESEPSGNETADLVVELLRETGKALHYREIEQELRDRGLIRVEGKNPANTLLARYFNDPRLYRPARGTYALRNGRSVKSVGTKRKRSKRGEK